MVLDSSGVICCSKVIRRYIRGSIYQDVYTVVLVTRRYIYMVLELAEVIYVALEQWFSNILP